MHFYVDESKAKGYLVAVASGPRPRLALPRNELSALVLPRQRSLHMKDEGDSRRRQIAHAIVHLGELDGIHAVIYDAGRAGTERERRARCLAALVDDAARHPEASVIFDRDESLVSWDRPRMIELTRAAGARARISYDHLPRHAEMLLAIPDAIAWSWARGGEWRERVRPVVLEVRAV
ncbi:hypothetical protein GCM10009668_24050 [Nocardioides dubius]|uniref:DUF3800 domain-containing protein n=1 Tax=Nocardioides dubius TaxID=317019 RepID=A0ABP4EGI4_9ACTN